MTCQFWCLAACQLEILTAAVKTQLFARTSLFFISLKGTPITCQGNIFIQSHYNLVDNSSHSSSKAASLAARLVQPNNPNRSKYGSDDEDDDAIFAELEEEIENDSNVSIREHGLQVLKAE